MNKQQLETYYYSHTVNQSLTHFQISRRTLFGYLKKYEIKKKTDFTAFEKWQMSLPDDIDVDNGKSYKTKWKKVKGKPLEWWANPKESEEERYIIRKNYLLDKEQSKKQFEEEINAEEEVRKCLHS